MPPEIAGIASTISSSIFTSGTLAPVIRIAKGCPTRSEITCRLVPGLPRSVGLGPVAAPPFLPGCWQNPDRPDSNQSVALGVASLEALCGDYPRFLLPASHAVFASRSCRIRSPFPGARVPRVFRFEAQTKCLSALPGWKPGVAPLWDWFSQVGEGVLPTPTIRLEGLVLPYHDFTTRFRVLLGALNLILYLAPLCQASCSLT